MLDMPQIENVMGILVVVGFLWSGWYVTARIYLHGHSKLLNNLADINDLMHFERQFKSPYEFRCDAYIKSKAKFDHFRPKHWLYLEFGEPQSLTIHNLSNFFGPAYRNHERYVRDYKPCIVNLKDVHLQKGDVPIWLLPYFVRKLERSLYAKRVYYYAAEDTVAMMYYNYTSPAGRNSYTRKLKISMQTFYDLKKQHYQNAVLGKCDRQHERNKMTASLRYRILRRDHFRCQICGRTADEDHVKLHVDHIVPIAKGGKTEPNNLRTLCQDCNLGKGAKFTSHGLN